jgi:hypothetical protein
VGPGLRLNWHHWLEPIRQPDKINLMNEFENDAPRIGAEAKHIPGLASEKQERFCEVAASITTFGAAHLDAELTGFALELWKRICRLKRLDCRRGGPNIWAASVTHVIARMNFLFDKSQPVHLTFDTICDFFQVKKTTVGSKAGEIERTLRLHQHSEPGLCRSSLVEAFTMVQLSNGMVMPLDMAKQMGLLPPNATPGT